MSTKREITSYLADLFHDNGGKLSLQQYLRIPEKKFTKSQIFKEFENWGGAVEEALSMLGNGTGKQKKLEDTTTFFKQQNKKLITNLRQEQIKTDAIVDACKAAILKMDIKPVKVPPRERFKYSEQQMHALRSDEQVGMLVDKARTQNISEYNFKIYVEYLYKWVDKVLKFKELDGKSLGLNKLVLARLGDHVEGETVFPGQSFHIDQPVVDQIFESAKHEVEALQLLAKEFNEIEIYCVCGNHGRVGRKGQSHEKTNWDYIVHKVMKEMLSKQKNIRMFISSGPAMIVKHGEYNFLYKHGDSVLSWMGIPFYGLNRDYLKQQILYNMIIHYQLVGHFHEPANLSDKILVNGSFPGGTEFSVNKLGVANRPCQKLFYFDNEHGINRESNLYLNDQWVLSPDAAGIYTTHE